MDITINGVSFDVELTFDSRDGTLDEMAVALKGSEIELSDVLSEKVLKSIEEKAIQEQPDGPDYEPEEPEEMYGGGK